jgi:hypothetical protein
MSNKSVYLVAYYTIKPKHNRVNTSAKGWMDNGDNVAWDEQISIATRLKTKDLTMAKVILDLADRSVYRNGWNNGKGFDDLFEHYYAGYQKYLDPVIEKLGYEMVPNEMVVETPSELLPKNETISSQ